MHLPLVCLLLVVAIAQPVLSCETVSADFAHPAQAEVDPNQKIRFDLTQFNDQGLYGPPDGLRLLDYEFCIPADPAFKAKVQVIDATLTIYAESPGRIGCKADEFLCIGNTGQPNFREVLLQLAALPKIERIEPAWFE